MRSLFCFLTAAAAMGAVSCTNNPKELSPEKYSRWIADEDHGLVKTKKVNGVTITVRYLPADYLAYKEYSGTDHPEASYDSILKTYQCGTTFQVSLEADKSDKTYGNLMYYGIASQGELTERTRFLSFDIQGFISLQEKEAAILPVLSQFDGYNELGNKLEFQTVFIVPEYNCGNVKPEFNDLQITFEDPIWQTGVNHFVFKKDVFTNTPAIVH